MRRSFKHLFILLFACGVLAACGNANRGENSGTESGPATSDNALPANHPERLRGESSFFDLFRRQNTETTTLVNRYLWNASLQVLDFLPIQSIDPFTGVIVTGFGTPPGGGRAYRATILIDDPALDARSLKVSLQSRSGPVAPATQRAVEDAILTRARQLRVADSRL